MEVVTALDVDVLPSVRLRRELDAQLKEGLRWSRQELRYLELAGRAADRAAELESLLSQELVREEPRVASVTRLSAELRLLERQEATLVAMLNPTSVGAAKSERHQRAANARWSRSVRHG